MVNIALFGAGRIAHVHAKAINANPQAKLVAVADPIGNAAAELADIYGAKALKDPAEALALSEVEAVVICSPTPQHPEQILAAVRAGKPVLCEKPVASDLESAYQLREALKEFDPQVMIGFNRRFDPSFATIKKLVDAGEIGGVEQVTITSRDPEPPSPEYVATSGGIFKDMTIHDFDMARFFLGDITEVSAFGQNFDEGIKAAGDYDAAVITLRNAAGVVATIINSRHCASGYDQRLEVFGAEGTLLADNVRPNTVELSKDHFSASKSPYLDFFLTRYADAYANELNTFLDCLSKGKAPSPTVEDGIKALEIAEAAAEAARSGRTVSL